MIKHFYSYHIDIESVEIEINSLDINEHEKKHLKELAESHIHHAVLDVVLSELNQEDKKTFISYLNTKDHEKIWKFLQGKVENIENKILAAASHIKKELLADINESKS